jgi:hypothetical protein
MGSSINRLTSGMKPIGLGTVARFLAFKNLQFYTRSVSRTGMQTSASVHFLHEKGKPNKKSKKRGRFYFH